MASKSMSAKAAQQAKVHDQKLIRGQRRRVAPDCNEATYPYSQLRRALQFQTIRIR